MKQLPKKKLITLNWMLDRYCLRRNGARTICILSVMQLCQAFLVAFWPPAAGATSTIALLRWAVLCEGRYCLVALLAICATMAIFGAIMHIGRARIYYFVPQHILLGIMGFGGLMAAMSGAYLDGTHIPWSHILNDQMAYFFIFSLHFDAIIKRARDHSG